MGLIKKLIGNDHKDFLEFILAVLYKLAYSDHVYSEEEDVEIRKVAKEFHIERWIWNNTILQKLSKTINTRRGFGSF